LVGEDGPTHSGNYDLSYMRCIPNMVIAVPSDENECRQLLHSAYHHPGPAAVRYPRGSGVGVPIAEELQELPVGKAVKRREGSRVAILTFGTLLPTALAVADQLDAAVWDMRFVKPLDHAAIDEAATHYDLVVTLEENAIMGGAGSAVNEYLAQSAILVPIMNF